MCVIIYRPKTAQIPERNIRACWEKNSDGWGIMFADNGRVRVIQDMNNDKFLDNYRALENFDLGVHFRIKTHGLKNEKNLHPFQVLDKDKHGVDLFMMHNGIIRGYDEVDKEMSDTWHFANFVLYPMLKHNPDLLFNDTFQKWMASAVTGSKLLFLNGEGKFVTINESAGAKAFDCWFSNDHSHRVYETPNYSHGNYSYHYGNTNNTGGADATSANRFPGWEHDDPYDIWWGFYSDRIKSNGSVGTAQQRGSKAATPSGKEGKKDVSAGRETKASPIQLSLPKPANPTAASKSGDPDKERWGSGDGNVTINTGASTGTSSSTASSGGVKADTVVAEKSGTGKPAGFEPKPITSLEHVVPDDGLDLKEWVLGGKSEKNFELNDLYGLSRLEVEELAAAHPNFMANLVIKWLAEVDADKMSA